jgi:hypothetical protein
MLSFESASMTAHYLKYHHGSARYQRPVPRHLQRYFGGVKVISLHIGRLATRTAEEKAARALSIKDDHRFAEIERDARAGRLAGVTDVRKLVARVEELEEALLSVPYSPAEMVAPFSDFVQLPVVNGIVCRALRRQGRDLSRDRRVRQVGRPAALPLLGDR